MNKNEVKGAVEEVNGNVAKGVGKVTGSKRLQAHGNAEVAEGKTTKAVGQVEGKIDSTKKDLKSKAHNATA